jgi:glycosyltransferase involved in cell wall biosynthesis
VVLSRLAHDRFRASGVSDASLRLIPPSVPPLSEPSAADGGEFRGKHGLPESAEIWIYPGDLEHGSGAEVALEGFAAYARRDALLLMACRDKTRAAGPARAALVDQAKRWGIETKLRWFGETPDIHELLALSDFTVLPNPSPYAKMDYPLVALEAMCMGRPVLVAKGTPAEELAEDGAAVAVTPTGDALAAAVAALSADDQGREKLGRRARTLVLRRFSPAKMAAKYEGLYEALHAR